MFTLFYKYSGGLKTLPGRERIADLISQDMNVEKLNVECFSGIARYYL